jgi:hypothetical protein
MLPFGAMNDLMLEVATSRASMDELRPLLDAALAEQFPGGMLQRRWEGDVLHVWGPGAQGTIQLDGSRLVGKAALKPPASLMRPLIENKMGAAMRKAAG